MSAGFSVVIPAYNYGHCIERAVQSVLSQSYSDFEVLVINDGSTDNTDEIMRALENQHSDVLRYIPQVNQGLSAVRNRGIEKARFPWLIFLDADDEMCSEALSALEKCAQESPQARLLIGGHYSCSGDACEKIRPRPITADCKKNFAAFLGKKLTISNGACAMHQQLFATVRYDPNLRHTEDLPVFAHVLANYPVATTPEPIAKIHKHEDSMRHDVSAALAVGMSLEERIFDHNGLPEWAQSARKAYRVRRLLSLLKICYRAERYTDVRCLYRQLFGEAPLTALQPRYLRRLLKSLMKS
ncbi:glycosyltransferase family 2 protein [Alcanivorax sp.]|uniref:glycosyltransferase family 2 protein n=1 Tax=Alcanivorax sp. TaxID=1872427 RepID=UPI000C1037BF|nr:glycosyltransferase family 2 protein [Alcanivorax sp.]PHR64023.1 MAG: glycosyl transferase family A [Alcanivorax sp.]